MSSRRYRLVIARQFGRDLRRLDSQVQQRVLSALARLEENPYLGERVGAHETGSWRLRVGDWRIRYGGEREIRQLPSVAKHAIGSIGVVRSPCWNW